MPPNIENFYTKDGQGDYHWDKVLWLLPVGAVVFLVGLAFALKEFTPPPQGSSQDAQAETAPAE